MADEIQQETASEPMEQEQEKAPALTFEERFDAVLRHLRDHHGIHLPEHLAPPDESTEPTE